MCDQCGNEDEERNRLADWILKNPRPCIICRGKQVGAGTWIAGEEQRLAVGDKEANRIFAFSLCGEHLEPSEENMKLITQAIIRIVRVGEQSQI